MKIKLGNKSRKPCPDCGGETVIEVENGILMDRHRARRCDELIENEVGNLIACGWSENIYSNGKTIKPFVER